MKKLFYIILIITIFNIILLFFHVEKIVAKSHRQYNCSMFKNQAQAQSAYNSGEKYLDGNKDGIACNSLLKKQNGLK